MDAKILEKLAEQFDELATVMTAISGTFRDADSGEESEGGDGKAAKPVRRAKPAASKPAAKGKAAKAEEPDGLTEDDMRTQLTELAEAKGKDKVAEALAEVGAGRLSEVEEESYQDLADAIATLMAAKAKPAAKGKAKGKAAPTYDEVEEAFKGLVDADRAAAKAVLKEAGLKKLSEVDQEDEGALTDLMTAITEAGEEDDIV